MCYWQDKKIDTTLRHLKFRLTTHITNSLPEIPMTIDLNKIGELLEKSQNSLPDQTNYSMFDYQFVRKTVLLFRILSFGDLESL